MIAISPVSLRHIIPSTLYSNVYLDILCGTLFLVRARTEMWVWYTIVYYNSTSMSLHIYVCATTTATMCECVCVFVPELIRCRRTDRRAQIVRQPEMAGMAGRTSSGSLVGDSRFGWGHNVRHTARDRHNSYTL